jgi:hypothetical protein
LLPVHSNNITTEISNDNLINLAKEEPDEEDTG